VRATAGGLVVTAITWTIFGLSSVDWSAVPESFLAEPGSPLLAVLAAAVLASCAAGVLRGARWSALPAIAILVWAQLIVGAILAVVHGMLVGLLVWACFRIRR
jgi:hypothetical protein